VEARNRFATATDVKSKAEADNMLTTSLKSLFALSEAYPELKANENFLSLQSELSDIENKIASARRYFNAATREYNTLIKQSPADILFHKEPKDYFE
jgi:LemA protein